MPAKSKNQQQIMGMALAYKRGELSDEDVSTEVIDIANSMTEKQLRDFAKTKHEGLPDKVEEIVNKAIVRYIIKEHISTLILTEKFKRVVRNKKLVKKKVCRPGYKLVNGKCVRMDASEKRNRKKSAKKASRKRRASKSRSTRKRQKSLAKRRRMNL